MASARLGLGPGALDAILAVAVAATAAATAATTHINPIDCEASRGSASVTEWILPL